MRTLLLVFVCISTVWGGTLDYDDYEPVRTTEPDVLADAS